MRGIGLAPVFGRTALWAGAAALCLCLALPGCGQGGSGTGQGPQQGGRREASLTGSSAPPPGSEPAPDAPVSLTVTAPAETRPPSQPHPLAPTTPDEHRASPDGIPTEAPRMKVDLATRRVFLPGEGWMPEGEFWDIYFNDPRRLPGDLDFSELHKLGYPREQPRKP